MGMRDTHATPVGKPGQSCGNALYMPMGHFQSIFSLYMRPALASLSGAISIASRTKAIPRVGAGQLRVRLRLPWTGSEPY